MKQIKIIGLAMLVAFISSCSGTKIVSSWKEKGASFKNYHQVLVLGLMPPQYRIAQTEMENDLVKDLKKKGINAISGMAEYGPKAFSNRSEQQVLDMLKNRGFDAVLTIVMDNKFTQRNRVPGSVNYQPVGVVRNRFYGNYSTVYNRYNTPGYTTTETNYLWETNMYNIQTDELLYTAQSKSFNSPSVNTLGRKYAKKLVENMDSHRLFKKGIF